MRPVLSLCCLLAAAACEGEPPAASAAPTVAHHGALSPLPQSSELAIDAGRARLGERLFFDTRLSGDGTVSCASCHDLAHGGADGRATARGIGGQVGPINTPSVLNAAFNFAFFWDGRAATLEEQARGPVENPKEMGARWSDVVARLAADNDVAAAFAAEFKDGVTADNVVACLAEFERTLITPDSPFDRFLRGEAPLAKDAEQGFALFQSLGCVACHQGKNIGGNMYQVFGVMGDYFKDRGNITAADAGRFNVTGDEHDRGLFKVPSLRNVAETAPYFHDGTAVTLDDAVRKMGRYQLGRTLDDASVAHLTAFLRSLSAPLPPDALHPMNQVAAR